MSETFTRPQRRLDDRVAVVTGAGAAGTGIGNGRAAAILLAEIGCSVVCVDLDIASAAHTADMCLAEWPVELRTGDKVMSMRADVTKEDDCRRVVSDTMKMLGRLDILVNNVGIGGTQGTAETVDMAEWARGMEVNVASMVKMAKYCIPEMAKNQGQWKGSIVNMASVAGLRGGTPHLLYPTTKGAVVGNGCASRSSRHPCELCLSRHGIHTDGKSQTASNDNPADEAQMYAGGMSSEAREARRNRSLLKTEGNGFDVGAAVRFLASDEARWLTGVILPVDAGATAATSTDLPKDASVSS